MKYFCIVAMQVYVHLCSITNGAFVLKPMEFKNAYWLFRSPLDLQCQDQALKQIQ